MAKTYALELTRDEVRALDTVLPMVDEIVDEHVRDGELPAPVGAGFAQVLRKVDRLARRLKG